jgi:phosphoribosylaminoimidazolecarboxamide formyltransferase/IMP cyclohydrolase
MSQDLKKAYHTIMDDHFPDRMEIAFVSGEQRTTLVYEKVAWVIDGVKRNRRYVRLAQVMIYSEL